MNDAAQSAETAAETPMPRIRLGKISEMMTQVSRRERHGVARNGAQREDKHRKPMQVEMVGERDQQMGDADSEAAEQHQRAAANAVDQRPSQPK